MAGLVRLWNQKRNPPAETTETFQGKTILITGATGGVGLAAAQQLAVLQVSRLIITARTRERGEIAKAKIQEYIRDHVSQLGGKSTTMDGVPDPEIIILLLDMSSFSSVRDFSAELQKRLSQLETTEDRSSGRKGAVAAAAASRLDAAILNAGTYQKTYKLSQDGYEETLQVNALSTALLASLLIPLLTSTTGFGRRTTATDNPNVQSQVESDSEAAHLIFVSSGQATTLKRSHFQSTSAGKTTTATTTNLLDSSHPIKEMSQESNFTSASSQYPRSKLVLEHIMRHVASTPTTTTSSMEDPGNQPKKRPLIVNSVCPGFCKTDLGRQFKTNIVITFLAYVFYTLFGRTSHQGANSYVSALTLDENGHGKLWKNDRFYEPAGDMIDGSEAGPQFGRVVWKEVLEILEGR